MATIMQRTETVTQVPIFRSLSDGATGGGLEGGVLRGEVTKCRHQHAGERGKPQAQLVRRPRCRRGALRKEVELLFLYDARSLAGRCGSLSRSGVDNGESRLLFGGFRRPVGRARHRSARSAQHAVFAEVALVFVLGFT